MVPTARSWPRIVIGSSVFAALSALLASPALAQGAFVPGEAIVKFRDGVADADADAAARGAGARESGRLLPQRARGRRGIAESLGNVRHLKLRAGASVQDAVARLARDPRVEYAEPNYLHHPTSDDTRFAELWGLENGGQTGGTPDADIDAPEAWALPADGNGIVVAVIDTGANYNHDDLAANIWTNPDEVPGNGIDDDGNGFVDDVRGWDFFDNDNDPNDIDGHGSHVSGTIAAIGNNSRGVIGVAWRARIMPLRFLGPNGGSTSDAVLCLDYAVANGAHLTNNSWGGGGSSQAMLDAINRANAAGVPFVAAAGNDGSNNDSTASYPSNYNADNVIAVAATDHNDGLASFSNYGATMVDLGAPGVDIWSTVLNNGYDSYDGTSMATPHVSGAAALLRGLNLSLTPVQLREVLVFTTDAKPSVTGKTRSGGRLNAHAAAKLVSDGVPAILTLPRDGFSVAAGASFRLEAHVYSVLGANVTATLGAQTVTLSDTSSSPANDFTYAGNLTAPSSAGSFQVRIEARDGSGNLIVERTITGSVVAAYQVATHTFGWTDISTQGTALSLGDDASALASLGFTFNYLGGSYSQVNVNSNGNLTFGGAHTAYTNESLATASITNIVAFFWDDLNPSGGGQVRVATLGSAGSRRFIVSFNGIKHYSTSGTGSFQAVLFEADSSIEFHYQDVNFGSTSYNGGKSATIGVKGGPVTQWSYNTTSVSDNSALRFTLPAPANAAPQAANDGYATGEDEVLTIGPDGVLANDTDADGDPLTAALVSGPSHGTLTLDTDGSFTYAPAANYNGPDSFAYRANDGTTSSNQATVSINVNAVNDAPTVVSDGYAVLEGQTLTVTAPGVLGNDADVDGDSLSASLDVGPQNGTLSLDADGSFTYTPNAGYYGYDSFSYDANDGNGGAATGLVTIYVRSNAVPVAYGDSYSTNEDAGLAVSAPGVLGNDTDGDQDPLTAALVSQPSNGTVSLSANGSFVYTPNANFHGSDSFSYTASDGLAASNEATVTINVGSVNDAPAATNDAYAVDEDGSLAVAGPGILGNDGDVDGDALTAVLVSGPTKGTLSLDGDGSFTYVPNANANGADSFTYRANDGVATSNLATVSITVNPTNDAPTAANDAYTANQGTTLNVAAPGVLGNDSDIDGDALSAVLASGPANGSITLNANGSFSYTPNAGFVGTDSFSYVASDGSLASGEATVTITVVAGGVHVGDLDGSRKNQNRSSWKATVNVLAHDTSHTVLAGATVSISVTGQGIGTLTATGTTGSNGWVSFQLSSIPKTTPSVTFTVTGVTHTSGAYNASLNHDPDGDSDGSSITVLRP